MAWILDRLKTFYHRSRLWRFSGELTLLGPPGLGDAMLITAVAHEVKSRHPGVKVSVITDHPDLFRHNPDVDVVLPGDARPWRPICYLQYERTLRADPRSGLHLVDIFLDQVGLIWSRRSLNAPLSSEEIRWAEEFRRETGPYITFQSRTGLYTPNKEWEDDRWQQVIDAWCDRIAIVQLGDEREGQFRNVRRMAGQTSVRQVLAMQSRAELHLGVVSFMVHSASAVGIPSVAIVGGYEQAAATAYPGSIRLAGVTACSPCWLRTVCPHDRECLRQITVADVNESIARILGSRTSAALQGVPRANDPALEELDHPP